MSQRPRRRDTREEIFDAALDCFARLGVAATGMEDIAAAAGVSRPTLYYHFDSKQQLMLEVIVRLAAQLHDRIRHEIAWQAATLDLIVTANLRAIELAFEDPIVQQLISFDTQPLTAELLQSEPIAGVYRSFWMPLLQAAVEQGELRDDLDLDVILNWMVFLQFSLLTIGAPFGLVDHDRLQTTLRCFLAPALSSSSAGGGPQGNGAPAARPRQAMGGARSAKSPVPRN
jgi:AcrR family transcriptional regulator